MHLIKPTPYLFLFFLFCFCNNVAQGQVKQIQQELLILSSTRDSISVVNSLNRLGTLYRSRNADSCFYYGMKAKRMATDIHYQKGQTDADLLIAYALFKRGLYAESLELLGKILPHYQQLDDTEKVVRVYMDMVEVLNKGISDRAKIISLLQKTIKTGRKLEKDSIMSEVYVSYLNRGPNLSEDSIDYYLSKSKEIASRYNDERMLNYNRMLQAHYSILNGQLQKALPLVRQSLSDARRTGSTNLEINSLFLMVGFVENNPKMALEYLYQAYEVAQKSGDSSLEIYILTNALKAANQLGDKDEIIKVYIKLEKAMMADWEKTKKFVGDYVRYNVIENDNKVLSQKNAQRVLWLVIISAAALIVVLTIYLIMLRRNRKAKDQIEALNNMVNMQIIAMEEVIHQAVREEQQRLGQDLHDGLSSSIASIQHQLETLSLDSKDIILKKKLVAMQAELINAYAAARNKSHEWFNAADGQQEQSFEQAIKLLTDSALPDSRYIKDVNIDDGSLQRVSFDVRIALLRIIQEAITNIIKHAKAKNVGILIYEEPESLVVTVSDDGKGLGNKKKSGEKSSMGLKSIQRRVSHLNGQITIHSDTSGTEITISIPLKSVLYG